MRAVLCEKLGPIESLVVREVDDLRAAAGQVVVDVKAAGANFPDILIVQGLYQMKPPLPFSPGSELAGVVREVGAGVTDVAVGDRVMAFSGFGAFAEQAVLAPAQCARMPDDMPFEVGGSLLLTYCTSHHALVDRGRLARGETLLVLGAAGGVGLAAIQIGKALGARVIAAASTEEKRAFCKAQGADEVIDSSGGDLKAAFKSKGPVDVVYDPVGGEQSEAALRALRPRGRFLVIGFASGTIPKIPLNLVLLKECEVVGVQWGVFAFREHAAQRALVDDLIRMWREGAVKPHVHRTYSLDEVPQALGDLAARRVMGKAVIAP
ncbi:MAG: NADPH:quinone oxidoreductase family protein [Myxococcota bacterium]|nr:NADPH:quinone oxidoreductase family protein [Myxococcota bacterium]